MRVFIGHKNNRKKQRQEERKTGEDMDQKANNSSKLTIVSQRADEKIVTICEKVYIVAEKFSKIVKLGEK